MSWSDAGRDFYSLRRSRSHREDTPYVDRRNRAPSPRGTSSDHPPYNTYSSYDSYRRCSRSHGAHKFSKEDFYEDYDASRVNQRSRVPHFRSPSDTFVYSDNEQYGAFDEALGFSGEDWDEISEDSASSLSFISAIPETDIPRIAPARRIRRRGSAPELGNSPDWEEIQIPAERGPWARRRQRPIEGGRLNSFGYRAATPDRHSRFRDERSPLGGSDISTRFELTSSGPTGARTLDRERAISRHDQALVNPTAWQKKLRSLEADVVINSALDELIDGPRSIRSPTEHVRHNLNILNGAMENLKRMQRADFCLDAINMVTINWARPNVANLVPITERSISNLISRFQDFLDSSGETWSTFVEHCAGFLRSIGLRINFFEDALDEDFLWDLAESDHYDALQTTVDYCSRAVAKLIDIAVISYCGAHVRRFDEDYLEESIDGWFLPCDPWGTTITLTRRSLKCLSGFFYGCKMWVFEVTSKHSQRLSTPLYLAAGIEEFADIWGPVWKTVLPENSDVVIRYNVGIGYVIPWPEPRRDLDLQPGEIFCHWTSDVEDLHGAGTFPDVTVYPYTRLIIGGSVELSENNRRCKTRPEIRADELHYKGLSRSFGTSYSYSYRDGRTVQVNARHNGFGLSLSQSYKRMEGVKLRDEVIVAWANQPQHRDHRSLQNLYGLEVSTCTENARRRSLAQILCSTTMRNFLEFRVDWSSNVKRLYFSTLESGNTEQFMKYLRDKRYSQSFTEAVTLSFEALKKTGNDRNQTLCAFWVLRDGEERSVLYPYKIHNWTGLLADSPDTCTVAVATEDCLTLSRIGLRCQGNHPPPAEYSVLQTALVINQYDPLPDWHSQKRVVAAMRKGDVFELRDHGRFEVIRPLGNGDGLLVSWDKSRFPLKKAKQIFKRGKIKVPRDTSHYELQRYKDFEEKPQWIPVHVVSNRKRSASPRRLLILPRVD